MAVTFGWHRARGLALTAIAAIGLGCTSVPPSAALTRPPVAATPATTTTGGLVPQASEPAPTPVPIWDEAAVELGGAVTDQPSGPPPGLCSPCHAAAISLLFAVTAFPGGFVAAGVEEPPAYAAVWTSSDGSSWQRAAAFPAVEGSVAIAAAADGTRVVIVGRNNAGATSWVSADGAHWTVAPAAAALAGPSGGTSMTSVVATAGGFVAGGFSDDPLHGTLTAAAWTSPDGLAWTRVEPSAAAGFGGAHILAMAVGNAGIIAVGTTHDETRGDGVAWSSPDGVTWRRASGISVGSGIPRAVTAWSGGFVAVGQRAADDGVAAWTSADGLAWQPVADQDAFRFGTSATRMLGVVAGPDGLVGVGWRSDAGNGSASTWVSPNGVAWTREPFEPTFSGGIASAVTAGTAGAVVAVGTTGYPDNDQAAAWLRSR